MRQAKRKKEFKLEKKSVAKNENLGFSSSNRTSLNLFIMIEMKTEIEMSKKKKNNENKRTFLSDKMKPGIKNMFMDILGRLGEMRHF